MNKKGFTLIELLVVVILIAAIVLLALPKITDSVKNNSANVDKITFNIIKEATKLYISDNENSFMKRSENTYCVSLNTLIEENYLKNTIEYNNQDITNTKVVKVTYDNGFKYKLVNKKDCERVIQIDTVCEADSEQLYATNEHDIGYKYNCKVDPDKRKYTFYVLSYNDEDGNIIFDKKNAESVNLIMDRNINSDGTLVEKAIIKSTPEKGIYNLVEWISETQYLLSGGDQSDLDTGIDINQYGPVTAMNFLSESTKNWTNTNDLIINTYTNENGISHEMQLYNVNARMPYYVEVGDSNGSNEYLYEYLEGSNWDGIGTKPTNSLSGVYGYWLLSVRTLFSSSAFHVYCSGSVNYGVIAVIFDNVNGVRPVINLTL